MWFLCIANAKLSPWCPWALYFQNPSNKQGQKGKIFSRSFLNNFSKMHMSFFHFCQEKGYLEQGASLPPTYRNHSWSILLNSLVWSSWHCILLHQPAYNKNFIGYLYNLRNWKCYEKCIYLCLCYFSIGVLQKEQTFPR